MRGTGPLLPVFFLTEKACRPGSRFLPFGANSAPQTKTSLRLSRPLARKAVCALPAHKKIRTSVRILKSCAGGDSNPQAVRHAPLKRTRIPIPPPALKTFVQRGNKDCLDILAKISHSGKRKTDFFCRDAEHGALFARRKIRNIFDII